MIVRAEWTGQYPCLCSGEWKLFIGDQDYSHMIPEDKRRSHMNTAGVYSDWHFEDWREVFEDYEDGLEFEEWLVENPWVRDLPAPIWTSLLPFLARTSVPASAAGVYKRNRGSLIGCYKAYLIFIKKYDIIYM